MGEGMKGGDVEYKLLRGAIIDVVGTVATTLYIGITPTVQSIIVGLVASLTTSYLLP